MIVQAAILNLLQRIDQKLKTGALITSVNIATWGTDGGDKFQAQRIMDIYDEARLVLLKTIDRLYPKDMKAKQISGVIKKKADLQFAAGEATKPTGFLVEERLYTVAGVQITILPVSDMFETEDLNNAANPIVYDYGTKFAQKTADTAIIPNASTYVLWYYGISTYTIADVTGGATVEEFNQEWIPVILQLAEAIAMEQGSKQLNALAEALVTTRI